MEKCSQKVTVAADASFSIHRSFRMVEVNECKLTLSILQDCEIRFTVTQQPSYWENNIPAQVHQHLYIIVSSWVSTSCRDASRLSNKVVLLRSGKRKASF